MLTNDGFVKGMDLGLARINAHALSTRSGMVVGSDAIDRAEPVIKSIEDIRNDEG